MVLLCPRIVFESYVGFGDSLCGVLQRIVSSFLRWILSGKVSLNIGRFVLDWILFQFWIDQKLRILLLYLYRCGRIACIVGDTFLLFPSLLGGSSSQWWLILVPLVLKVVLDSNVDVWRNRCRQLLVILYNNLKHGVKHDAIQHLLWTICSCVAYRCCFLVLLSRYLASFCEFFH